MSSFGTLFAEEQVRDFIKGRYPYIEFRGVEHHIDGCNDSSSLPDSFEISLLDDNDKPIVIAEVVVRFEIVEDLGSRYIGAEVGRVDIKECLT